ncbi:MAG: hypothetical protein NTV64_01375 [Polaromonas sp.]|nr:hypothetical protein [Polaromonas sp.]
MEFDQAEKNEGYGFTAAQSRKMMDQMLELRDAQPGVQLNLSHLAEQLTRPRAKTFATEALGRRLPIVERTVLNVFRIYPPDRRKFIEWDESADIAIQLHAFAINVYALFDNIAWICTLEANLNIAPLNIGLFKPQCQAAMPADFRDYLAQLRVKRWYNDYGKVYRDSTAHRIPPYLPPRVFTQDEAIRWQDLHAQSMGLLKPAGGSIEERLALQEKLEAEKHALGRNSIMMGLSLTGEDATPPVYLHPQMLCDWGLAHELVQTFTKTMRAQHGWPEPIIPPMVVRGPF